MDVWSPGTRHPRAELLESEEMAQLVEEVSGRVRLRRHRYSSRVSRRGRNPADAARRGVILVTRLGQTTREEVRHLADQLKRLEVPTLGVVANRVSGKGVR